MSKVSFIGLGVMGYPMAGHISKGGHKVTVFNRTISKAEKSIGSHDGHIVHGLSATLDAAKKAIKQEDPQYALSIVSEIPSQMGVVEDLIHKAEISILEAQNAINVTCLGAFLVSQEASKRMLKRKSGSIFFTGATAGVKGFANSSVFAMGKFALRGLAQSLARELHPQNIHIGHFVIDGAIGREPYGEYQTMHPDQIAKTYLNFHNQEKSAWAWEIELRTSVEKF